MAPSATDQAPRAHLGRELFSNHFLEVRLRDDELWEEVADEAEALRSDLRELLARERDALAGANEDQTEERWVKPVLRAMGWGYEVQPASKRHGTVQFPDYALFLSQDDADEAAALRERRRVLKQADGVLEAKRWGRDLDAGDPTREDLNRVPSTQIINYLIRAEQPWGVLTNGMEWRLYHRDADFADTSYFAVDLPALLRDEPVRIGERGETIPAKEGFRFFYLFFRPEAFRVRTEDRRWLDVAYRRSVRYARAVEEALKPRAYRAVEAICRGFAAAHDLDPVEVAEDEELAETLLDNALTLLFRLLFLHYAESRDLLPVRTSPTYRRKSLLSLRERAAEQRDAGEDFIPRGRDYWDDLEALFGIVDGAPEWRMEGIPVYNGGLFDPDKHPWLEDHYVADPHLAEALDLLSRTEDPETGELHYVDYGPLDVRNLGSIYEGLLEHKLQVAEEEQPAVRRKGRTVRNRVPEGDLYLANEKGERKTTGSYYTPDYVVEHIVQKTLSPLVEGKTPSEILELTVLDPAMGSGHFLVSATSYLAREAVRAVEEGEQHLLGDFAELDPDQLRRLVVERCIFGVDKNPRAVELAKLSLWIATVQKGKPLNFLDHHLKCGDSLLGAPVAELGSLPGRPSANPAQMNAFEQALRTELDRVLELVHTIERLFSDSLEDVQHKVELYRETDELLDRFRAVADIWCSALLGNEDLFETDDQDKDRSESRYARAVEALRGPPTQWEALEEEPWFREARRLGRKHNFFHWEVEFSEVFFREEGGERENPGFDAVIGNPPYVRMEEFKGLKDFLRAVYASHATRTDMYIYFMERSVDLLREGGEYGVIVSNKFLRANYGQGIRTLLAEKTGVRELVDFGGLPVFPDATVRSAILLARKGATPQVDVRYAPVTTVDLDKLGPEVDRHAFGVKREDLDGAEWRLVPREVSDVLEKLESRGTPLEEVVQGQICWGIKTGRNEAFFIDGETRQELIEEDPRSEEVIKPLVVGNEVRRYRLERGDHWLLYMHHGVDIERYPAVEAHLEPYREKLEGRATDQAWYELQQPQEAYVEYFEGPKVLYPEIAREARFAVHPGPLYPNNKCFLIPGEDHFLLALLNSTLALFFLRHIVAKLEGGAADDSYYEFRAQYMERLPVWRPADEGDEMVTETPSKWLRTLYEHTLWRAGLANADREVAPITAAEDLGERVATATGREPILPPATEAAASEADAHDPADLLAPVVEQVEDWLTAEPSGGEQAIEAFLGRLARRMSELHEQRLSEVKSFLDWLEDQLGCPIDDLTGKTYVRAYWEQPEGVEKLLETIERNRPSSTDLDVRKPEEYGETNPDRERIVSGYRRSMETLRPLVRQLELTDELIDQLVYRVYGLTEAEVEVVEEHAG